MSEYSKLYDLNLSDYFILALCHELGHIDDQNFNPDNQVERMNKLLEEADTKMRLELFTEFVNDNIKKEFTAHKNGGKYVPVYLRTSMI